MTVFIAFLTPWLWNYVVVKLFLQALMELWSWSKIVIIPSFSVTLIMKRIRLWFWERRWKEDFCLRLFSPGKWQMCINLAYRCYQGCESTLWKFALKKCCLRRYKTNKIGICLVYMRWNWGQCPYSYGVSGFIIARIDDSPQKICLIVLRTVLFFVCSSQFKS